MSSSAGCAGGAGNLGHALAGGAVEEFVDEGLVGLGLFGGEAAEAFEERGVDANGDELFGVGRFGAADAAGAFQLFGDGFGDVAEVDVAIGPSIGLFIVPGGGHRLGAPCGWLGVR